MSPSLRPGGENFILCRTLFAQLQRQAVDGFQAALDPRPNVVRHMPCEFQRQTSARFRCNHTDLLCSHSPAAQDFSGACAPQQFWQVSRDSKRSDAAC